MHSSLPPELREELATLIGQVLEERLPEIIRRASLPPFLDTKQASRLLQISPRQLGYLREKGRLPFIQRGRTIRYATQDIEKFMHEGYVPRG